MAKQYCRNVECGWEGEVAKGAPCPECSRTSLTVQPPRTFLEEANLKLLGEFAEYAFLGGAPLSMQELKTRAQQFISERRVR